MKRNLIDHDFKYINNNGDYFQSRTQLSLSLLLEFLEKDYEYNVPIKLDNNTYEFIDFKIGDKYIEVIDSENDLVKFNRIKEKYPKLKIISIGQSKYSAKLAESDSLFLFDSKNDQIGSIFIEDPSLSFDYAHILPLVPKCSILHGHTSTIMVEIIGSMKNGLVIDFSEAKKIVKKMISNLDHKFFINKEYLINEDDSYYYIKFNGPKGFFNLQLPKT
ncbi:MAG: 6-pyruvoyl trahydropterin synthase family protein, partial [Nitrososphaeraceae archaeon]